MAEAQEKLQENPVFEFRKKDDVGRLISDHPGVFDEYLKEDRIIIGLSDLTKISSRNYRVTAEILELMAKEVNQMDFSQFEKFRQNYLAYRIKKTGDNLEPQERKELFGGSSELFLEINNLKDKPLTDALADAKGGLSSFLPLLPDLLDRLNFIDLYVKAIESMMEVRERKESVLIDEEEITLTKFIPADTEKSRKIDKHLISLRPMLNRIRTMLPLDFTTAKRELEEIERKMIG